jgi:Protein of unknown function (DUF3455)
VSVGAVATLFLISPLLPYLPEASAMEILEMLPTWLISYPVDVIKDSGIPIAGEHHFNSAGIPVFDLEACGIGLMEGAKIGDIAAPTGSCPGPHGHGNGAVDWLTLSAKPGFTGISEAYRVLTAGGKAPATCDGQETTIEIEYAGKNHP